MNRFTAALASILFADGSKLVGEAFQIVKGEGKTHLDGRIFKLTDEMMNANAALWSIVCCYNMNLYDIIQRADKNGIASLERLTFNYTASNPLIPYSLAIMKLNEKVS